MTALARAREMYRDARGHHRAAARERKAAERAMDALRSFCDRNGIAFEIVKTESEEGHGHGTEDDEARAS